MGDCIHAGRCGCYDCVQGNHVGGSHCWSHIGNCHLTCAGPVSLAQEHLYSELVAA